MDIDWVYRKIGRFFLFSTGVIFNGLNQKVHSLVVVNLISKIGDFAKAGHVHVMAQCAKFLYILGVFEAKSSVSATMKKRSSLGLLPVGLTALFALVFVAVFLLISTG